MKPHGHLSLEDYQPCPNGPRCPDYMPGLRHVHHTRTLDLCTGIVIPGRGVPAPWTPGQTRH